MSAQAVSALNAVKANQAKKAESLLARVEKPVPGKPGITELPEQTSEDLLEELPGEDAAASVVEQQAAVLEPATNRTNRKPRRQKLQAARQNPQQRQAQRLPLRHRQLRADCRCGRL
jgi:hypothetical protein